MIGDLEDFLAESLRIEGIHRRPTTEELAETEHFLALGMLTISDVVNLVNVYQPDAVLRDRPGLNVRVGRHVAPYGGDNIARDLGIILAMIHTGSLTPYKAHCEYEKLHPFTDGNGRSGRAIWLWMTRDASLGFLHAFYYQTLDAYRP